MINILILGTAKPTRYDLTKAHNAARSALGQMNGGQTRIITGDGYGIEAEVAQTCEDWRIPLLVVGVGKRPSNSTPLRYYERFVCMSRRLSERLQVRNAYLLGLADRIIIINDEALYKAAVATGKPAWLTEAEPEANPQGLVNVHLIR